LHGWIQVTSTTPGLDGFFAAGDFATWVTGLGALTPSADQVLPVSGSTLMGVANPGTSAASVSIKAYDSNATQVGTTITKTVPPKGFYDAEADDGIIFGSGPLSTVKHLRITATGPVVAPAGMFPALNRGDGAFVGGTDVATAPNELNFAHVVSGSFGGASYTTLVGITNPSASAQTVTMTFNTGSGTPLSVQASIPANGSSHKTLQELFGLPNTFQSGWLQVRGVTQLVGFVSYTDTVAGGVDLVPVQASARTSLVFGHIADLAPWWTGLALLNTSATDTTVEVFAMNPDGSLIGGAQNVPTARFTLPAQSKVAKLLQEFVPATQSRSADGGFVFVRTTNNVALFGVELFFLRSGAAIANVAADTLAPGITFTPPSPN